MKEQLEKLLADRPGKSNEEFVKSALNLLEREFRKMCLSLLGEITLNGIHAKSMYAEIAALQRPSWGCWNGFLLGILKERRNLLNTGTQKQREKVSKAEGLAWIAGRMEEPEAVDDASIIQSLEKLGCIQKSKRTKGSLRTRELLAIPIYLRNRIAHDNIQDSSWWTDAGSILLFLLEWYGNSDLVEYNEEAKLCEPWLYEDSGQLWCYNGISVSGEKSYVRYVSTVGEGKADYDRTASVILAFKRVLGEEEQQENNFKRLMYKMAPEELRGFLLGGYIVGEKTGEGGFAEVFKGTQLSTGRKVAIKVLKSGLSETDSLRFLREAEYLSMFDHPNIEKIYEQNEQPWTNSQIYDLSGESWFQTFKKNHGSILTYIVMEWIEGSTLDDIYINMVNGNCSYSERDLAGWFEEAAEALEVIHNANLIHRDISPKNIMITDNGQVKLMDFGISRTQYENHTIMTSHGKLLGSEPYMSPEQLDYERAKSELGPRSDIYSLGATFYELFTKTRLYNHNNNAISIATANKLKEQGERPDPPKLMNKEISWEISTILMGCVENEQSDRYGSAQKLKEDIKRYLNNLPIEYKKPGVIRRLRLMYKRNRRVANISALFILLIVLSTSVYIYQIGLKNGELHAAYLDLSNKNHEIAKKNNDLQKANGEIRKRSSDLQKANADISKKNSEIAKKNTDLQKQIKQTKIERDRANQEKDNAETQRKLAVENALLASKNEKRAIEQRDLAMGMIKKLTYDVAPKLYEIPNAKPLLSDIMIWNTQNINKMLNLEPNSYDGFKAKIINFYLIGDIWKLLGKYDKAKEAYKSGRTIAENLLHESGTSEARLHTAIGSNYIAYIEMEQGYLQQAAQTCLEGIGISKKLVEDNKRSGNNNDQALQQLGACYDYLGNIYMRKNDLAKAVDVFEEELKIRKQQIIQNNNILVKGELSAVYGNLGQTYQILNNLNSAEKYYEQEMKISKELSAVKVTPEIENSIQKIYTDVPYLTSYALNTFSEKLAVSYGNMGSVMASKGDTRNAIKNFMQEFNYRYSKAKDSSNTKAQSELVTCSLNLAYLYELEGSNEDVLKMNQYALEARKKLAEDKNNKEAQWNLVESYSKIGEIKNNLKDYNGALEAYNNELEVSKLLARDKKDTSAQINLFNNYGFIGIVSKDEKNYDGAIEAFNNCLKVDNGTTEKEYPMVYEQIANICILKEDYTSAVEAYYSAVMLNLDAGHIDNAAEDYKNIGDIKNQQQDFKGALEAYNNELSMRKKVLEDNDYQAEIDNSKADSDTDMSSADKILSGIGENYSRIANVKWEQIDLDGALEAYNLDLKIEKELVDRTGNVNAKAHLAERYSDIGYIRLQQGNFKESLEMYTQSKKIYGEMSDGTVDEVNLYNMCYNASLAEEATGNFEEAFSDLDKSMSVLENFSQNGYDIHEQEALVLEKLASVSIRKDNQKEAIDFCEKALDICGDNKDIQLLAKARMAIAYALDGNAEKAEETAKAVGNETIGMEVYTNLKNPVIRKESKVFLIISDMIEDLRANSIDNGCLDRLYALAKANL
ncbi:MAG TPA: protein kinase [Ruminiclostridium sp.]|nr:protein kinase [Ruminiclostridium sp.]